MDPSDADWESIMIYPSNVGGSGPSGSPVLKKPNGDLIGKNLHPSTRDVSALTLMYEDAKLQDGPLLNNKKHKKHNIFKRFPCKPKDGPADVDECETVQEKEQTAGSGRASTETPWCREDVIKAS